MLRNSIGLERIFADSATSPCPVYTPVPENSRSEFRYWRGACMGRLLLNIMDGISTIDAGTNGAHFAEHPLSAQVFAVAQTTGLDLGQWNAFSKDRYERLLFRNFPTSFPAIVFAHANPEVEATPSDWLGGGVIISGTRFTDIDPYSRKFLENYFEVNIDSL